jgi:hypothetical protein
MTTGLQATIEGACLCGAVAFAVGPPYRWFAYCHCSLCRKHHGTLFSLSLAVVESRLRWLSGEAEIVHYRATPAFERPYCGRCGSKVPGRSHEAGYWNVPVGLLDGELGARPRSHIFVAAKSSLHTITDSLPQHAEYPPGIALPSVTRPARAQPRNRASGSCLCGAIAFEFDAAAIVHCHCAACRHSRGTGFSSSLLARNATFHWREGRERLVHYAQRQVPHRLAAFCRECGSIAPHECAAASAMLVPAGSLDTEPEPLRGVHANVAAKAPWDEIADVLPRYAADAPSAALKALIQ